MRYIYVDSVDVTDEQGLTGLMWAAGYGQLGSARLLIKWGANVNFRGPKSETTLHLAAAYGHHDLVKLLLNNGADPNAYDEVHATYISFFPYKQKLDVYISSILIIFIIYRMVIRH